MNAPASPLPGPPRIPDHELFQRIGRGSYGEVWRARTALGAARAVKIVRREAFEDERPFQREFNGVTQYEPVSRSHPGLVHVLHVGQAEDRSCFYYSMELADDADAPPGNGAGPTSAYRPATLATLLARSGALPIERALDYAIQLAEALRHLHAQGLVHRDIKPSNVIFVNGRTKLADLGLVSALGQSQSLVGTEGYLAPEGGGTRQADIFSLGKVIYEMITGHDRTEFPNLPAAWVDHPQSARLMEFNEILARTCARNPDDRYADAGQLAGDLALIQGGRSVRRLRQVERRLVLVARAALALALAGIVAVVAFALQNRQYRRERELRERTELAERESRQQLHVAERERAVALIHSRDIGRRSAALAAIGRAATIAPAPALRDLVLAAESLPDLRPISWAEASSSGVTFLALSPDWKSQLRARTDGVIERKDLATGQSTTWPPPDRAVVRNPRWIGAAFGGTNHQWIGLREERTGLWIAETGQPELRRASEATAPGWMTWDPIPGTDLCVLGFRDRHMMVCDPLRSGGERFFELSTVPNLTSVSPDGKWLAATDWRELEIVALADGRRMQKTQLPAPVRGIVWSADSSRYATAHWNFEILIWDRQTAKQLNDLRGHNNQVLAMTFLNDGRWFASSGWDGTLRLWDVFTGRELARQAVSVDWLGQDGVTGRVALRRGTDALEFIAFDPPQQPVAVACFETSGTPHPRDAAFHPGGRWLAVANELGIACFDLATGREIAHLRAPNDKFYSVHFEPGGGGLVASGPNSCLRWPLTMPDADTFVIGPCEVYVAGNRFGESMFSPDGKQFLLEVYGHSIRVRDENGSWRQIASEGTLQNLDVSPDGRWLASGTHHLGWARVWDLHTGRRLHQFQCAAGVMPRFTPDGRFLMTCSSEEIAFWNLETGRLERRWPRAPHTGLRGKVAWTAGATLVAVTHSRTQVQLRQGLTDKVLCSLPDGDWEITCLEFDAAGEHLAVVRDSGEIELWNLRQMRQRLRSFHLDWDDAPATAPAAAISKPVRIVVQ